MEKTQFNPDEILEPCDEAERELEAAELDQASGGLVKGFDGKPLEIITILT